MIRSARGDAGDMSGSYNDSITSMMVVVCCDPMNMSRDTIDNIKTDLVQLFADNDKVKLLFCGPQTTFI